MELPDYKFYSTVIAVHKLNYNIQEERFKVNWCLVYSSRDLAHHMLHE